MSTDHISTMQTWHTFMRPVLESLADGVVCPKSEMEKRAVALAGLSEVQQLERLESGQFRSLN